VGLGSTFTLWLPPTAPGGETLVASEPARVPAPLPALHREPVARTPVAVPADDRDALPAGARVLLVVEDDEIFAKTVCDTARAAGYRCLIATTADDGIALALRHRPTAIVLDVGLPDHTGLAVLDRLKHNSATRHIPVQVVSAEDHSQPALEMGAAGVMLKPVRYEELLGVLSTLERKASPGERMILVVEDNDVQRDSICRLLESQQVRTVAVDTAGAALERLQSDTFDCMVLDLSLPDASGYQLLETMAHQELYAFPPVIVYTGRALSPDDEQQLRRYSRSIIVKGARSPERLLDEVTLFLHQVESQLPPDHQQMLRDARSRDAVFEGRRILVVEDDVRNIFALSRVLEPNGVEVVIARNGREAVERVERQEPIDLILMDIMMPEMDGLEATRRIRALPGAARLPIIALTAKAMPDDHQRCLDAGADDYLTKPIDVDKLLSLIRVWLPREASIGRSG
jgi:CheY-like chemotaxis protein